MDLAELILALDRPWPSPPMEGGHFRWPGTVRVLRTMSLLVQRPIAWNVKTLPLRRPVPALARQ
ncbi:hypothetical protein LZ31DRAFT_554813 [Colletotrichum somersetense]|nr:hypothetical protein LZ31DRAFT_554813 [Colletotrichum somersetense]